MSSRDDFAQAAPRRPALPVSGVSPRFSWALQGFGEGVVIRGKLSQIDLVTAHRVLGDVLDFQLQLRLAHFFLAAGIVQIAQRFARACAGRLRARFTSVKPRRARRGDFATAASATAQFRAIATRSLLPRRHFRAPAVRGAIRKRDVGAPGGDQLAQLGLARGHRLALACADLRDADARSRRRDAARSVVRLIPVAQARGSPPRLSGGRALLSASRKLVRASSRLRFELRDAFRRGGELLIERRLFPRDRVDFAVRFVQLALERASLRGAVAECSRARLSAVARESLPARSVARTCACLARSRRRRRFSARLAASRDAPRLTRRSALCGRRASCSPRSRGRRRSRPWSKSIRRASVAKASSGALLFQLARLLQIAHEDDSA